MSALWGTLVLVPHALLSILRANGDVIWAVVRPSSAHAAVIGVELTLRQVHAINAFANLVTLAPGTVSLEIAEDRSKLYLHVITTRPLEEIRSELRQLQHRVMKAFP